MHTQMTPPVASPARKQPAALAFGSLAAALLLSALPGCSAGESEMPSELEPLMAPPAGQGQQYKMVTTLTAGQEIERCQFVVAPPEGLNVNHDEVRYTPGSHHVLLYLTDYKTVPTVDNRGKTHDTSGVFDCAFGATADWSVTGVIAGAQSVHGGSMVSLPPDTAVKVPGGAVMLMNTHYLNARPTPLTAEARVNVHTIPDAQVKQFGGVLFFYNPFIRIPAMAQSSARLRCKVGKDITLTNVQSHMHRRGMNYVASLLDAQGKSEPLYSNTAWEDVPVKKFDAGKLVPAGTFFDYRCDYNNTEDRTIVQGPSSKDEMCMLIGSYYPRDPEMEGCDDAQFVGTGNKSCQVSAACALGALAGSQPNIEEFYGCVVDSCESAAAPLTDALVCYFQQGGKACETDCAPGMGLDPVKCQACVSSACQPKMDACRQAKCE